MKTPNIAVAGRSHVGNYRAINEDAVLTAAPVFLVADGMGGHQAGALAAQTAVASFRETVAGFPALTQRVFEQALAYARQRVAKISASVEGIAGCTLSGVAVIAGESGYEWLVANIGDSRVYLLRDNKLSLITNDHSLLNEMLQAGYDISDPRLPKANIITRALGSDASQADLWRLEMELGDRLLICTDGLSGQLDESTLLEWLRRGSVELAADLLMETVLEGEAPDNVSVIVLEVATEGEFSEGELAQLQAALPLDFERRRREHLAKDVTP
ncbi:PP2C family protein-serine/threonine phosphatase [Canibacter zhoujuaniae]|uniref:PP2C family protein-serine/threonine phosphatase n=1 Tax=Canibacter zhoujuaniae TaxID=2708343 RepID=UPI0014249427|nr:protein phosphatase 2C domain-containing protein [Canibacter zhoujuaniae]